MSTWQCFGIFTTAQILRLSAEVGGKMVLFPFFTTRCVFAKKVFRKTNVGNNFCLFLFKHPTSLKCCCEKKDKFNFFGAVFCVLEDVMKTTIQVQSKCTNCILKGLDGKKNGSSELTVSEPLNSQRWAQRKMSEKSN